MVTDYTLLHGDCLEVMPTLAANSVDTIVTDPPYGLSFMGKDWDHGVPGVAFWREALRVAKPGAMLLAFGGSRTFHRLTCAIEDAGWEVRDCVMWLYGSGFPKSLDISKAIDKAAGEVREVVGKRVNADGRTRANESWANKRYESNIGQANIPYALRGLVTVPATLAAQQWHGWGTSLKPAFEPIIMAMKPLDGTFADNAAKWGVAGLNVDGARIATDWDTDPTRRGWQGGNATNCDSVFGNGGNERVSQPHAAGRWPANLILDEEAAAALDAQSGVSNAVSFRKNDRTAKQTKQHNAYGIYAARDKGYSNLGSGYPDSGGASRYFKVVKVAESDFSMYNISTLGGVICGQENTKDGVTSAGKRTESNGGSLRADGHGNSITGLFLLDAISITKTATLSIMTFPILSVSTSTNIGTCIIESESDISWLMGLNLESVSDASNGYLSIIFNGDQQAHIKATARIVSGQHSQNGANKTANTITPTCGSTTSATSSRFFYVAKASRRDRGEENIHPTCKPSELMRYLVRLTATPFGGVVLDPFCGSGTTGVACMLEGRQFVGIEREAEYVEIARRRIEGAMLPLLREAAD